MIANKTQAIGGLPMLQPAQHRCVPFAGSSMRQRLAGMRCAAAIATMRSIAPPQQSQGFTLTNREDFIPEQRSSSHGLAAAAAPSPAPKAASPAKPTARRTLMAGNWKLNPGTVAEAQTLAALLASAARTMATDKPGFDVEVCVVPPAPFLSVVKAQLQGTAVRLGCQDVHAKDKGAFTGAVSAPMVKSLGVEYVLCGHSERRVVFGDTDEAINAKVRAVLDAGLDPILCIGESKAEYEKGLVKAVCGTQLSKGLAGVSADEMRNRVVIAYEPVWAIGTGLTATPAIAQSVHAYIRSVLAELYGADVSAAVRIQYGGSVTPESVDELMTCPDVDGCLVGGASLAADKFARIVNYQPAAAGASKGVRKLWAQEVLPCVNALGESPVWSARRQRLYWANSVGQELWEWDLVGRAHKWELPEVVGCVALQQGGLLLLPLESGIYSFNPSTGSAHKLCDFEPELGSLTRPNDGRVDREGNFVIGSYNNTHRQDGLEIGSLWRLSATDGRLREILDYKHRCSNCISFTPSGETVFFCDTPTRRIFAFDYSPSGGLRNRRLLYEMPAALPGGPDGAQVDAQGHLWAALSGAGQVVRIAPDGSVDTVVELPVSSPTSCTIGGPDLDTLFITTRGPDGGGLYSVKLPDGVRGVEEPEFRGGGGSSTSGGAGSSTSHAALPGPGGSSGGGSLNGASAAGINGSRAPSSGSSSSGGSVTLNGTRPAAGVGAGYCDACGSPYPRSSSCFCGDCGVPRAR